MKFGLLKHFRFKITFLFFGLLLISCSTNRKLDSHSSKDLTFDTNQTVERHKGSIIIGAERFEQYILACKDKNIGIVTNQTGVIANQPNPQFPNEFTHILDFLLTKNIKVTTIFAPEHGFRGTADAGELIKDGKDIKTGLPIISLYGSNKKPKPEQLKDIHIMLFDIQDVGARFYTYISTLHYVMEACAENNIPLLILDRPNPNGTIIDGPILEKEHKSFVGMHEIPILHGMTIGEYANMINGEKWLKDGVQCDLKIIPCLHYTRDMKYSLPIKPSPNLPNDQSINLYASLCLFEGTNVSVGRGTEKQFQIFGSPFLPYREFTFSFTPKPNLGAKDPVHNGKLCFGEDLSEIKKVHRLELKWLLKTYENTSDKTLFFNDFFTKLAGTKKLREQIEAGMTEKEIRKTWQEGLEQFKEMRKKYLIYE